MSRAERAPAHSLGHRVLSLRVMWDVSGCDVVVARAPSASVNCTAFFRSWRPPSCRSLPFSPLRVCPLPGVVGKRPRASAGRPSAPPRRGSRRWLRSRRLATRRASSRASGGPVSPSRSRLRSRASLARWDGDSHPGRQGSLLPRLPHRGEGAGGGRSPGSDPGAPPANAGCRLAADPDPDREPIRLRRHPRRKRWRCAQSRPGAFAIVPAGSLRRAPGRGRRRHRSVVRPGGHCEAWRGDGCAAAERAGGRGAPRSATHHRSGERSAARGGGGPRDSIALRRCTWTCSTTTGSSAHCAGRSARGRASWWKRGWPSGSPSASPPTAWTRTRRRRARDWAPACSASTTHTPRSSTCARSGRGFGRGQRPHPAPGGRPRESSTP